MRRIEAAEDELTIELRRPPTMNEIAEKMNVSVANLSRRKNRLDMDHSGVTVSLKTKAHVTDSSKIGDESSLTSPQPAYLDAPMGHEMMENIVDDIVVSIHAIPERDKAICLFSIVEGADIGDIVTLMNTNPGRVKAAKETLAKVARVKIF
jgi:DNA-directed RNA polymerase specialized sigma subunit